MDYARRAVDRYCDQFEKSASGVRANDEQSLLALVLVLHVPNRVDPRVQAATAVTSTCQIVFDGSTLRQAALDGGAVGWVVASRARPLVLRFGFGRGSARRLTRTGPGQAEPAARVYAGSRRCDVGRRRNARARTKVRGTLRAPGARDVPRSSQRDAWLTMVEFATCGLRRELDLGRGWALHSGRMGAGCSYRLDRR